MLENIKKTLFNKISSCNSLEEFKNLNNEINHYYSIYDDVKKAALDKKNSFSTLIIKVQDLAQAPTSQQIACYCNGFVEDCDYCCGTGMRSNNKGFNLHSNYSRVSTQGVNSPLRHRGKRQNKHTVNKTINTNNSNIERKEEPAISSQVINYINNYTVCEFCGDKLHVKNIIKHKRKCRGIKKNKVKKPTSNNIEMNINKYNANKTNVNHHKKIENRKPILNPKIENYNIKKDYKDERKLDGSRDFYTFRERGKFGSHSAFDDMGDDSNP